MFLIRCSRTLEPFCKCGYAFLFLYSITGCINLAIRVVGILPTYLVPCSNDLPNGGWTVIQRRVDEAVDFYRGWDDYVEGFGDPDGSMWLGLEAIHTLSTSCPGGSADLFVYLESFTSGDSAYARYSTFSLGDASTNYKIIISGYSGTAGDGISNNAPFSTHDSDNDSSGSNCAVTYHGAWWYTSCHSSNLNGRYFTLADDPFSTPYAVSVCWQPYKGYHESLKYVEMKMHCT